MMVLNKYKKKLKGTVRINCSKRSIISKDKNSLNLIYLLLDQNINRIKVFDKIKAYNSFTSKGYQHIGNKLVSRRESKLISLIVEEFYKLGFSHGYNKNLIGCLNSLGFNTNSSNRISKKIMTLS